MRAAPNLNLRKASLIGGLVSLVYMVGEIAVLVWLWQLIGWWVVALMTGTSLLGTFLIRHQARKSWHQVREAMQTGALPPGDSSDKLLKFAGAVLLIMPGFIGNLIGAVLFLPFARTGIRRLAGRRTAKMFGFAGQATRPNVIRGDVVDDDVHEGPLLPPLDPPPGRSGEEDNGR